MAEQVVLIFENPNSIGDVLVERDYDGRLKKGNALSPNTQFKKGMIPWNKGKEHLAVKGEKNSMKRPEVVAKLKANPNNIRTRFKKGSAPWNKGVKNPYTKDILRKLHAKHLPTSDEKRLDNILQTVFPGKFRYVGDWQLVVDRLNPDFVGIDNPILIIDLFGEHWHDRDSSEENERKERLGKQGYKTLIIWVRELDDRFAVAKKINDFINDNEVLRK